MMVTADRSERESRLKEIVSKFSSKRILVLGDFAVFHFVFGDVRSVSLEAPIPVLEFRSEVQKSGGAMLVANCIKDLGGEVAVLGVVGDDPEGSWLARHLQERGIGGKLITSKEWITPTISRYVAREQQVFRVDRETVKLISKEAERGLCDIIRNEVSSYDGIVIADYEKGSITPQIVSTLVSRGRSTGCFVMCDARAGNIFNYLGVDYVRTNERHASNVVGIPIINETSLRIAGTKLLTLLGCKALFVSRGPKGITFFERADHVSTVPATRHVLKDKTGLGDVVTATMALSLACDCSYEEAATLATYSGGIKAQKVGAETVSRNELLSFVEEGQ